MDFSEIRASAERNIPRDTWTYFQGTADGDLDRDTRAWQKFDLIPQVLTELSSVDPSITLGGDHFASPIIVAPTASQGAAHADGELATRRAGAAAKLLVGYSYHASVAVETFAEASDSPWWAQAYILQDRGLSDEFLKRCARAGARAVVLTVDVPGSLADADFRRLPMSAPVANRGNYPKNFDGDPQPVITESRLGLDDIARTAEIAGLPVWVKGIMNPVDAERVLDAGAAGVFVSNHARRQLAGVAPTAAVLKEIVDRVAGRAPVVVDGGIRSGIDAVRALCLGATAVAIGRPVPWALAAGGEPALTHVLHQLTDEVRVALAGLGAGSTRDLSPSMIRPAFV